MATITDLIHSIGGEIQASCDVCIVGAGAAGLYLASTLARGGVRVIVLEAGGQVTASGAEVGIEPTFESAEYRGATEGRAFGWGGSTSRWGGVLVPHSDLDLRDDASATAAAWRHVVGVVNERSAVVLMNLGLSQEARSRAIPKHMEQTARQLRASGLETMVARALPFRLRNFTRLASGRVGDNFAVYLNAAARDWEFNAHSSGGATVRGVRAVSAGGAQSVRVEARHFVLAAGAIESARILLEMNGAANEHLLPSRAATGAYLSDHLSCAIARVEPGARTSVAGRFAPAFVGGCLSTLRIVEKSGDPAVPRHFAHFIFEIENNGFRLVREVLRAIQAKTLPRTNARDVLAGVGGLSRLVLERASKARLYVPPATETHLQLDVEQTPLATNCVRLSGERDKHGRRVSKINWRVGEEDVRNIRACAARILDKWRLAGDLPPLRPVTDTDADVKPYDAYHPVGTCRMGDDEEATVTFDLRVRGTRNAYVLSTGVLPSAGSANPTFSMLCLGHLLADHLVHSAQRPSSRSALPC